MRILQIVPRISPQLGGPSVALPGLARCLAQHGVETTVLATNVDANGRLDVPLNQSVTRDGVEYLFHHVSVRGGRYGFSTSLVTTLHKIAGTYDLIHIHGLYDFACIVAARAAIAAGVPFIVQPMGSLDPYLLRKNRLAKRMYLATIGRPLRAQAAAVVFTSEQERALASYGPRRPEWVIPVGLDSATFSVLPKPGAFREQFPRVDRPFLLFVGRLSRQKGLDLLLEAFARLAHHRRDLQLVLAGPDPDGYRAQLQALSERLGIDDRVVFTGFLTHEMKLAAFVDATLFVLPSYAENFGAVVTEALACGLPVVISNQVNIHGEMAAAGVATVVECTVDSVTAGITSSLADTGLRGRIAVAGPALVRAHYTWDVIVPLLMARYHSVIVRTAT